MGHDDLEQQEAATCPLRMTGPSTSLPAAFSVGAGGAATAFTCDIANSHSQLS